MNVYFGALILDTYFLTTPLCVCHVCLFISFSCMNIMYDGCSLLVSFSYANELVVKMYNYVELNVCL